MDAFDLIVAAVAVSAAVGGYRLGFLGRVTSWIGLSLGFYLAVRLLPTVLRALDRNTATTLVVVAVILLVGGAMVGQAAGLVVGSRLHKVLPPGPARQVDRVVGSVVGAAGVFAVLWLLLPSLAAVPGWPARAVSGSAISRWLARDLPTPPAALEVLRRLVSDNAPQVFSALEPNQASGPPPAGSPLAAAVERAVYDSTVRVEGSACGELVEGSGFAVAPGLVVTNAHVVAGQHRGATTVLRPDGTVLRATVVVYDSDRDLALLSVPSLGEAPLGLADPQRGQLGAVFGHPGGQAQVAVSPARVSTVEAAVGPDIYDSHSTHRNVLVLAANLAHGDSGGPLADTTGHVIGVAFAISASSGGTAYALNSSELRQVLGEARADPASTGACLTSG